MCSRSKSPSISALAATMSFVSSVTGKKLLPHWPAISVVIPLEVLQSLA